MGARVAPPPICCAKCPNSGAFSSVRAVCSWAIVRRKGIRATPTLGTARLVTDEIAGSKPVGSARSHTVPDLPNEHGVSSVKAPATADHGLVMPLGFLSVLPFLVSSDS
jgi:hypothetical protein